ncbi:hypothetical protein BSU04_29845 [Caballeronia sordidicola]|uniref:Uncharacterized protein n=1 Tax=Caballeronia sordidicola TaxID=196367 RepID=A0A226WUK3_CABSO|nr:hypothetical protein BSU04_29845 [Caballeronia sordidicola]
MPDWHTSAPFALQSPCRTRPQPLQQSGAAATATISKKRSAAKAEKKAP